jgi:hypothetical protein
MMTLLLPLVLFPVAKAFSSLLEYSSDTRPPWRIDGGKVRPLERLLRFLQDEL